METVLLFIEKHFEVNPGMTGLALYTIIFSVIGILKSALVKSETFNWIALGICCVTTTCFSFAKAEPIYMNHTGVLIVALLMILSPFGSLRSQKRQMIPDYPNDKLGSKFEFLID